MIRELNPGADLCGVRQHAPINARSGQIVEVERLVHVLNVHQHVEDVDVVAQADAGIVLRETNKEIISF